jgi:mannose-6-phosphate isomerase-like protein (cupin superfamily)
MTKTIDLSVAAWQMNFHLVQSLLIIVDGRMQVMMNT